MRLLTSSEQRQIEQLKWTLHSPHTITIEICDDNREMWLNALEVVLSTQEAMKTAWCSSQNPQIDLIQAVKKEIE